MRIDDLLIHLIGETLHVISLGQQETISYTGSQNSVRPLWPLSSQHARWRQEKQLALPWQMNVSVKFNPLMLTAAKTSHRDAKVWTLPMLRLLSSKAQEQIYLWKTSKLGHVGIHWIALAEYSQMSTRVPGFQSFFRFFTFYVLVAKFATRTIRVNPLMLTAAKTSLTILKKSFRF